MPHLPVRDLADVPLADAFDRPGCPVCRRVSVAEDRFVEGILDESVNDVGFRRELDERRGFCRGHTHAVLATNRRRTGSLSSGILLGAVLRVRRRELEAAGGAGGRSRARRVGEAARPPDCPICAQAAVALSNAVEALVRLAADPDWSEALSRAPLCLEHLTRLLAAAQRRAGWEAIEARQVERLAALQERLDAFAHHSSEDRRHLLTDAERAAVDEAASALGGEE